MSFRYNYLDDVALADAAFEVWSDSWGGLFAGATEAMTNVMVSVADLNESRAHPLTINAGSVGELLYDWLSELVYLKDTVGLLVKSIDVDVQSGPIWQAHGILHGDTIDVKRHRLGQDVKAVTYHLFDVSQNGQEYKAKIVLDI